MSTIRQTILDALGSLPIGYSDYVDRAVAALEEREYEAVESIITDAGRANVSYDDAREAIDRAGLQVRPEPEPVLVDKPAGNDDYAGSLVERIERLERLAREHLGALN